MTAYYQLLGLKPRATLSEIKKAYRKKAKQYHPDLNPAEDAQERFVEINEAYEYLINRKTGKIYSEQKRSYQARPVRKTYRQWREEEREKARERARKHARMKYRAFKNSSYYKNELALDIIGDNMGFYLLLSMCIVPPILGLSRETYLGFWFTLVIGLAGIPIWQGALKPESNIRLSLLFSALYRIVTTRTFLVLALAGLNLFLFLKVVMHTLIPLWLSGSLLALSIALGFTLVKYNPRIPRNPYTRSFYAYGLLPGLFNLFFLVNYLFASNLQTETYTFRPYTTKTYSHYSNKPNYDEAPILLLENDAYTNYLGIRLVYPGKALRYGHSVKYAFADGLLGLRVMKDYEILSYRSEGS